MASIVPSELRRELRARYWRILDGASSASEARTVAHDLRRLEALAPRVPGWDDRHAYFEQTARPVTERMLERLAPARGHTILELAAGTGIAGFAASALVGPGGRVIVSDFSEAMVETAERQRPSSDSGTSSSGCSTRSSSIFRTRLSTGSSAGGNTC